MKEGQVIDISKVKQEEFIRLMRWIASHQSTWSKIYLNEALEPEECLNIIQELEKQGFYILIPVVIENSKSNYSMHKALYNFVLNKLADDWAKNEMVAILAELSKMLQYD